MEDKIFHLSWGLSLAFLYNLLGVMMPCIQRLCSSITPIQTLALITLGENVTLLPFSGVIFREWSIKKRKEWLVFSCLALLQSCYAVASTFCAERLGLGKALWARTEKNTE